MDTGVKQFVFPSKIGAGSKALEHLPFDLGGFGAVRPMVVCTADLDKEGGLKPLEDAFKGSGLTFGIYGMDEEPSLEIVREVWTHYNDGGFDAVIAVGGGSVVDVAKCLTVAAAGSPDALRTLLSEGGRLITPRPLPGFPPLSSRVAKRHRRRASGGRFSMEQHSPPTLLPWTRGCFRPGGHEGWLRQGWEPWHLPCVFTRLGT